MTLSEPINGFTWLEVTVMFDGNGNSSYSERTFDTGVIPVKLLTPEYSAGTNPVQFVHYDNDQFRSIVDYIYGESSRLSAGESNDHWANIVRVVGYK